MILRLALAIILFATNAEARLLYVNSSTGNDSTPIASNSSGTPWATIGRAAWGSTTRSSPNASEAAAAGDTVYVAAGTYSTVGQGSRFEVAYDPVNAGTAGNLIKFIAVGTVTLTFSSGTGPVIGSNGSNYIRWEGFTINESSVLPTPDTGPVVANGAIGVELVSLVINGVGDASTFDNHPGIRLESCDSCLAANNRINNFLTSGVNGANGAGIQVYESDNVIIENNESYNSGSGIFIKGPTSVRSSSPIIRYNYVHDNTAGIILSAVTGARVYQNIVEDSTEAGILFWDLAPSPDVAFAINSAIFNNTVHNSSGCIEYRDTASASSGLTLRNNITSTCQYGWFSDNEADPNGQFSAVDRNVYYSMSSAMSRMAGTSRTLAQWQSAFSLDSNSITTDPSFVSAGNYHLNGGSAALTLGRDTDDYDGDANTTETIPAGAYISGTETIGYNASYSGGGSGGGGGSSQSGNGTGGAIVFKRFQ